MWVDIYGRQARWNGSAWELVKGQGDFDKPESDSKPTKDVSKGYARLTRYSGLRARIRLDDQDPNDPLVNAYNGLSDNQIGAVRLYTYNYYTQFNNYLRGRKNKDLDEGEEDWIRESTSSMIEALNEVPNSPTGSYYRGMSGDPETSQTVQMYAELEPGDILSDKGFGSYTSDKEIPGDFMTYGGKNQNILLINRSGRLKSVEQVTANPGEYEHLSMPGAEFRVKKNEIVEDRRYGKMRVIEIEDV